MTSARHDIETRDDCEDLVRTFYTRALSDAVIGFIFTDVARLDLEAHVPRITSFWETILLGAQSYSGGAFRPHAIIHAKVPLRRGHFERWLWLWQTTVDELFAGPRAELAEGARGARRCRVPRAPGRNVRGGRCKRSGEDAGRGCRNSSHDRSLRPCAPR